MQRRLQISRVWAGQVMFAFPGGAPGSSHVPRLLADDPYLRRRVPKCRQLLISRSSFHVWWAVVVVVVVEASCRLRMALAWLTPGLQGLSRKSHAPATSKQAPDRFCLAKTPRRTSPLRATSPRGPGHWKLGAEFLNLPPSQLNKQVRSQDWRTSVSPACLA